MEKIEINGVDKTIYREVLKNGLEVILLPNEENTSSKKNYYVNYGTYYGALDNSFVPYDEKTLVDMPAGIAHFLEHKLFEREDGESPFTYFKESGSYINAFTSYKSTSFILSGSKRLEENLEYFLTFINEPYFTRENVEKEQGIIQEEIHMNLDNPDYATSILLAQNLYQKLPYRIPIVGTEASIAKITPQKLMTCYKTFYQPSNMFLVIAGAFDKDKILSLVKKIFVTLGLNEKSNCIKRRQIHEGIKVKKAYEERKGACLINKLAIGYKMKRSSFPIEKDEVLDLYLSMLLSLNFGASSKFREYIMEHHLVSKSGYSIQGTDDIITFVVEADSNVCEEFMEALEEKLKHLEVLEEDMERLKKVWISSDVIKSDYADAMLDALVDDLIQYHKVIPNYVTLIRSMNMETMQQVIKTMDFSNRAIVKMVPNEKADSK